MVLVADTFHTSVENIEGLFINHTHLDAGYGEHGFIEHYNEKSRQWEKVPFPENYSFYDLGHRLPAGVKGHFSFFLPHDSYGYPPGRYRISKEISIRYNTDFRVEDTEYNVSPSEAEAEKDLFKVTVSPAVCSLSTDSITITVTNQSPLHVRTSRFYKISRVTDEPDGEYYSNYSAPDERLRNALKPGQSFTYKQPLHAKKAVTKKSRSSSSHNFQADRPRRKGTYRIRKDFDIPLSVEFILSDKTSK